MWLKRWSVRATPANANDKIQSPLATDHKEFDSPVVTEPSVKPVPVVEDEPADAEASSTNALSIPKADDKPPSVGQDTSSTHEPVQHITSNDPVMVDTVASPEVSDDSPPDGVLPAQGTPLPDTVPKDKEAQGASDADTPHPATTSPPTEGQTADIGSKVAVDTPTATDKLSSPESSHPPTRTRRLSFRSLAFFYGRDNESTSSPAALKGQPAKPLESEPRAPPKPKLSRSEKRALSSAVSLRTLIIGPARFPVEESTKPKRQAKLTNTHPPPDLKKLKSELLNPKHANAVIAQLRRLPLPDGPSFHPSGRASAESLVTHPDVGGAPIHAVCLACTDEEADQKHFSRLRASHTRISASPTSPDALSASPDDSSRELLSIGTASLETLIPVLENLRIVSLLASPDLGFGQPVSEYESGPLTGAVPSSGAVVNGFEEITKQLMSLGFATSKAVFPSHAGIYPPEDRMSVLTYWWGLELVLPEPSVKYLSKVKSISNTLLNLLSALALFNNGVLWDRANMLLPVANFVDFEWSAIKAQDKGRGVVCAATWIMPAAMVPRPWDFPSRPASTPNPTAPKTTDAAASKTTPAQDKTNNDAPATLPNVIYPPVPLVPMLPQLTVTPATLPRGTNPPENENTT